MTFVKTAAVFAVPTVVKLLSGLLIVKIVAIYLGADGLGKLGQFMSLMSMLAILSTGGISTGIIKYIAEFRSNKVLLNQYIEVALLIILIVSVFVGVVFFLFAKEISFLLFNNANYWREIKFLSFFVWMVGLSTFLFSLLSGLKLTLYFASANVISVFLGTFGVLAGCVFAGYLGAIYGLIWMAVCPIIPLSLFCYLGGLGKLISFPKPKFNRVVVMNYAKFGVMQLVTVGTMQLSQIVIRGMIEGNSDWVNVGYWQGLNRVSDAYLLFITLILANYYLPRLSETTDKLSLNKEVLNAYKCVVPILLIFAFIVLLLREFIVRLLFTPDFVIVADLLTVQVFGDVLKVLAYIVGYVAVARAASVVYVTAEIFQASLLVFLSWLFLHEFGLKGVVYAYVLTYLIYSIMCFCGYGLYLRRNR